MGRMVSVTPQPRFIPRKRPQYPLDRRLGGPHAGLDTEALPLPEIEPRSPSRPARSQTAQVLTLKAKGLSMAKFPKTKIANKEGNENSARKS
jgi:hypothetical protein